MISRTVILKAAKIGLVERVVRQSSLFRPVVNRFIAGDTLEEALNVSKKLLDQELLVSLDYLGENAHTEAESLNAKAMYIEMLNAIAAFPPASPAHGAQPALKQISDDGKTLPPSEPLNISIKLTQCGLDLGSEVAEKNLREVLWAAEGHQNYVRLDMESSAYTELTISMLEKVFPDFQNVGTVLQSYLYRTDEDVERLISLGARCRLVKGAYLEPPSVAYKSKAKVDEAYVRQAKRLLDAGFYPAFATQDENMILEVEKYVKEQKIDKSKFEFQMLLGIRRDLQVRLEEEGYNVRIYVPYGKMWYPYFTRRLAERPANLAFIMKAMIKG